VRICACSVCGRHGFQPFLPAAGTRIRGSPFEDCNTAVCICRACGFVALNPLPAFASRAGHERQYYENAAADWGRDPGLEAVYTRRLEAVRGLLPGKRRKAVLDVGAGTGFFLGMLAREDPGNIVFGLDAQVHAVRYGRKAHGLENLYRATLEESVLPERFFDLVCLSTLSTVYDPTETFQKIRRLLKPDGILFLEMRNLLFDNATVTQPGFRPDLYAWLHMHPFVNSWFHEAHVLHVAASNGFALIHRGRYDLIRKEHGKPWYWYALRPGGDPEPAAGWRDSLEVNHAKVHDYFTNYCERVTLASLAERITKPDMKIGLLGPAQENAFLAGLVRKAFPRVRITAAEMDRSRDDPPEDHGPENRQALERNPLPEIVSDRGGMDAVLLTRAVRDEEFRHLQEQLKGVSESVYRTQVYEPRARELTRRPLLSRDLTTGEPVLMKSFLVH